MSLTLVKALLLSPACAMGRLDGGRTINGTRTPPSPMNHFHHCRPPVAALAQEVPMKPKALPAPMSSIFSLKCVVIHSVALALLRAPSRSSPSGPLSAR